MNARTTCGIAAVLALAWGGPPRAGAAELDALLGCSPAAPAGSAQDTRARAEAAGWQCRELASLSGDTLQCTPPRGARALGLEIKEFERVDRADGGALVTVAFRAPPERLRAAVAAAGSPGGLREGARVGEREDGVGELSCPLSGTGQGAGSIAGTLSFRGVEPLPAMRVCAAPRIDPARPVCVETATGQSGYRIGTLPPGEYYVTAFPLEGNPARLFAAHTRPMTAAACATFRQGSCPDEQLVPVAVRAGHDVVGIDPSSLLASLPPPLGGREATMRGAPR